MEEKNNFLPSCTQEVIQSYKVRSVSRFVDSSRPLARVISQSDSSSMSFSACRRADDDDALLRATRSTKGSICECTGMSYQVNKCNGCGRF